MERIAAMVMLSAGWRRLAIALAAGAFAALMLPPFGVLPAGFVSFTVLVWLIDGASGNPDRGVILRRWPSFLIGWSFGLGYFVASLWWTANALLVDADEFAWAVPLAAVGLPAYLAVYYGLAAALARMLWTDGFLRIVALAASFGLAEWLRGIIFTGFPWNAVGQGLMPFPLMMQSLALIGGATMNIAAVFIFAAPALLASSRGRAVGLSLATLLFAAHLGYGGYALYIAPQPAQTDRIVRLVQPAISQADKLDDAQRAAVFQAHLDLTKAPRTDGGKTPRLIVWPETSVPFILTRSPDALSLISDALEDGQTLFAGAVRVEGSGAEERYYNSIYMIDSQGQIIGAADKVHLVPFGEFLPFEDFFRKLNLQAVAAMPGGFSAALQRGMLTLPDGFRLLPLICYEIIFPDEIEAEGSDAPDVIINITNDEWFGVSPGPWQHFLQARLAAVETGLPVIRDANSGISAMIDPRGRVTAGLAFGAKGFIDTTIPAKIDTIVPKAYRNFLFGLLLLSSFLIVLLARMGFVFQRN